jgi:hypothetical protein
MVLIDVEFYTDDDDEQQQQQQQQRKNPRRIKPIKVIKPVRLAGVEAQGGAAAEDRLQVAIRRLEAVAAEMPAAEDDDEDEEDEEDAAAAAAGEAEAEQPAGNQQQQQQGRIRIKLPRAAHQQQQQLEDHNAAAAAAPAAAAAAADEAADDAAAAAADGAWPDCPICFDTTNATNGVLLACGHALHGECLAQFLNFPDEALCKQTNQYWCPACKADRLQQQQQEGQEETGGVGYVAPADISALVRLGALTAEQVSHAAAFCARRRSTLATACRVLLA